MAGVLKVSRSGYYQWRDKRDKPSARQQAQQARDRADQGIVCNTKTISAGMTRQRLLPKAARRFKATTDSQHALPAAPNLLQQDFTAAAPNQKWAGDITYLRTNDGRLYLAHRSAFSCGDRLVDELTHDG